MSTEQEKDEEFEWYMTEVDRALNAMVVLDDCIEDICTPEERLKIVETVAEVLGVEPDCLKLWQILHQNADKKEPLQ